MERLREIINDIESIKAKLGLEFSGDMVLDCAVRIFNAERIGKSRTERGAPQETKGAMASEKQIGFLKRLGFKGETSGMTMKEASDAIKRLKED